jgi:glycerophosphoryl diester phosphodiesterase
VIRLVAAALLLLASSGPVAGQPLIAAHRGGAALRPENSLLGFRNALDLGADFLETDVHLTADGEPVILHDPTLDRTTTGTGPVAGRRLADLAPVRLRAADGTPTNEPLPTLVQLLDLLRPPPPRGEGPGMGGSARVLLEIKLDADRRAYPKIEDKILALIRTPGLTDRVLIMAFQLDTLRRIRALDTTIPTVLLISKARMDREGIAAIVQEARDIRASHLSIDHRAIDPTTIAAARAARLTLAAWTVNAESDMRRVIGLGIDILISDRPELAKRITGR